MNRPPHAPRAMERLAAFCLRADADDSRLGDLAEQYVRHFRRAHRLLGGDGRALAHAIADARYLLAAANVAMFTRTAGPGPTLAAPVVAKFAAPIPVEETMAPAHRDARQWMQPLLLATALAFLAGGAIDLAFSWRQTEALIASLQREKAEAAAAQIEQIVAAVQDKMAWSMDAAAVSLEQRRTDALRLLRQVPEVTELAQLDADGKELLWVSRLARDRIGAATDYAGDRRFVEARSRQTYVGPVYFRGASEPYVSLALGRRVNGGVVLAELSLRGVKDAVRAVRVGETGYAYVVDGSGRLIAGPEAPAASARSSQRESDLSDTGLTGVPVFSAQAVVPTPGWRVFVEWPVAEARQPLWNALLRGACVLGLGLAAVLLAVVAARWRRPADVGRREGFAPS